MSLELCSGHSDVCQEICDALGLKHVRKLDIHMAYDEIVTVKAELYPEIDGMRQIAPVLKKYRLLEIKEPKKVVETTVIGDQIASFAFQEEDKTWLENAWLSEASYGRTAWYAKSIDRNTVMGTTNAWEAMKFNTQDECCDWIDSWQVPELEKSKYTPVNHGFVHEGSEK